MKKILELKLRFFAKKIIAKYKPDIIAITGSVGKTTTKEAVYTVLKEKFAVRRNVKNYNNEIGLPLTIIGVDSPGKNIFGWISVFWRAIKLIIIKNKKYPEILVLETGIDHPGDMDYLMSIIRPKIGIVTTIGTVHVEYFGNQTKLRQEKAKLIKNVIKTGWSIINYDNHESRKIIKDSSTQVLTYGFDEKANIRAKEVSFLDLQGISFKISYKGSTAPVLLPNVLSEASVYSALAAVCVGITYDMNLKDISKALKNLISPKGRTNLIKGIKNTMIIDDSYNAEPKSMHMAIGILKRIPIKTGARRFAVLGDMLELGKYSEEGHKNTGKYLARCKIDKLITVGERSRDIGRGAIEAGMEKDNIFHFSTSEEAGKFVQDRIKQGDTILVKGSQGVRMEKIVLEIMADPLKAKDLLVRQEDSWK